MESPKVTGVHKIWPNDSSGHLPVYCDQTSDGGGSLYIQPAQQGLYRAVIYARLILSSLPKRVLRSGPYNVCCPGFYIF